MLPSHSFSRCFAEEPTAPSAARARKRRHDDTASELASAAGSSAPAHAEKRPRQHTSADARAEVAVAGSDLSFEDIQKLKHVEVLHHNSQMPAVQLWQADVKASDPETKTFSLHVVNTREDISGVPPARIFRRRRGSAAV